MKTNGLSGNRLIFGAIIGALVYAIISATVIPAYAQQSTGSISGIVKDPHNAYVPGASVKLVNCSTNVTIKVKTNKSGVYNVSGLLPGYYDLFVEMKGFAVKAIPDIRIGVGKIRMDIKLEYPRIDL
jgi:uncharacterized surface anchored protein